MNLSTSSIEFLKIMRCSKLFQPTIIVPKTHSKESDTKLSLMSKSQKLLIDMGIIRQSSAGIYHLLPLGVRSMNKLKTMVRKYLTQIEAQEVRMPLIIDGSLWKKSGRWGITGAEVFKFRDRHENDCILSPTNEESVTELIAGLGQLSYRQLPFLLYQVASKFRDEIKPRCGLIRTKEFEMMDAYSFDESIETAQDTYERVSIAFENIFNHLELPFMKVLADPGDMGGEISHEYHFVSDVGEDKLKICETCNQGANIEHNYNSCPSCGGTSFKQVTGIEVGHTFLLGTRYTLPLECKFTNSEGKAQPLIMASYGLGLTRILAASLELLSTDDEIIWPAALAPFSVCIISPKDGSKEWNVGSVLSLDICKALENILPDDVILDDRCNQTIGKRLRHARQTGYPYIVCVGKGVVGSPPLLELVCTATNTTEHFTLPDLIKFFEDSQRDRHKMQYAF